MTLLFIDTETGGLTPEYSILSITFTTFRFGQTRVHKSQELNLFVRPDDDKYVVHPRALEVNQIDLLEHYEKSITYSKARSEVLTFLKKINKGETEKPILCGQNIDFDLNFLESHKILNSYTLRNHARLPALDLLSLGTFAIIQGYMNYDQSLKLIDVANFFKIPLDEDRLHMADYDNEITAKVLFAYTKMLGNVGVEYAK